MEYIELNICEYVKLIQEALKHCPPQGGVKGFLFLSCREFQQSLQPKKNQRGGLCAVCEYWIFQKYDMITMTVSTDNIDMSVMIFLSGAAGYSIIEYLFRGYTHWSMALTGGACLLTFYFYVRENRRVSLFLQAAVGACIFTVFEFFVGMVVNVWFGWHVWDYSGQPGNIMGQICPLFSFIWFMLCMGILMIAGNMRFLLKRFYHT